jgi:hypothetical protein
VWKLNKMFCHVVSGGNTMIPYKIQWCHWQLNIITPQAQGRLLCKANISVTFSEFDSSSMKNHKGIDWTCSACVCCTVDFSYKKSVLNTGIMLICPWSNNILEISSY